MRARQIRSRKIRNSFAFALASEDSRPALRPGAQGRPSSLVVVSRSHRRVCLARPRLGAAIAAGDLSRQTPIEVTVTLGSPGKHEFTPKQLKFETGKLYKLILRNDSNDPHYFTSHAFSADGVDAKAQVTQQRDGKSVTLAEFKGAIREIEVYPGTIRRMVAGAGRRRPRHRPALRHQGQRRQDPRRPRHDRRDRHRVIAAPAKTAASDRAHRRAVIESIAARRDPVPRMARVLSSQPAW